MVSHHALDADTELGEVSDSGLKKSHGTFLALIWHNLHEGDARSIIDADVDELPTDAMMAIDRATIATGDAMSHRADPAELLNIEMDQLARVLALIAADRLGRLQRGESVQPEPMQDAADGCWRYPDLGCDLLARVALPA